MCESCRETWPEQTFVERMDFPFEIKRLDSDTESKISKYFTVQQKELVQVGDQKWLLPQKFENFASQLYNFEVRPSDVFICTLPRSGTTWTQDMIWLICNDLDYETASKYLLDYRFPFLDRHFIGSDAARQNAALTSSEAEVADRFQPPYETLAKQATRRFIKTHLPMQLLPRKIKEVGAKVVYVARNPKDVAVSLYHFQNDGFFGYRGDFETHLDFFMNDLTIFMPYWKHILDGWSHRHDPNVHFMFYEDAKRDIAVELKKLAAFLEKPLKDADLPGLMDYLKFENAKKNLAINYNHEKKSDSNLEFVRRGQVGGNPEITDEISARIDEWTKKNLDGTDFKFPDF